MKSSQSNVWSVCCFGGRVRGIVLPNESRRDKMFVMMPTSSVPPCCTVRQCGLATVRLMRLAVTSRFGVGNL